MMVKPAGADDAEDAPPSEHAADPSDPPEEEEDADAMDALLGVGHDLRGAAAAPPKSTKSKSSSSRRSGAAAAPKPPDPSHDMDESAKMLMLLGELGGQEASDPSDHSDHSEDQPPRAASRGGSSRGARDAKNNNAAGDRGASKSGAKGGAAGPSSHGVMNPQQGSHADPDAAGAQAQGPVGEWLKAEGEARMKMADHRRLIYRWTNAIYRLLGMKIPRGMGSLFDKGEKNKREKFDRFLSYYYGTETFEPGTYWYNNADTIQFFVELVRVATRDRYAPEPVTIQKLFRKKDPTRQASTWIMVQEELDKTDVSAEELRALFEGPPRVENGFPRGRPLLVPIPKNPKGHHKYNNAKGGGGTAGGGTGTGAGAATDRGGDASAPASPAPPVPASLRASSCEGGVAGKSSGKDSDPSSGNSAFAAAKEYAARAHAAARRQHAKAQARHRSASAQHEAMFGAAPRLDPHDSATARAMNAARRRSALATSLSGAARGFLPLVGGAAGIPGTDFGAVAMAQAAAAAAAPGACEGITLAPSPMKAASPGGGQGGARDDGGRGASGSGSKKRHGARLEGRVAPIRRLHPDKAFFREVASAHDRGGVGGAFGSGGDLFRLQHKGDKGADPEGAADRGGSAGPGGASASAAHAAGGGFVAAIPPSPTRLVGEILLATLADVAGPAFGMKIAFDPDEFRDELESLDPAAETEEADDRGGDARGARAGGDPPGAGGEGGPAAAAGAPPPWSSSSSSKRSHEHAPIAPSALAAAREGRERLMSLGEEVTRHLPSGDDIITPASSEDPSDRSVGFAAAEQRSVRTPREPVVDRTALGAQVDSVLVAAKAAESAWRRHAEALRLSARAAKVSARCDAKLETARDELAGAELALAAAEGPGAALVEPGLRDAMRRAVEKSVAAKKKTFENADAARSRAHGDLERHRAQAATSLRAFKPQYDEVRKRALRLRLAAEERAERQVARALSRAERAAEETAKRAEKVAAGAIHAEGGGGGGGKEGGGGQQKANAGRAGGGDEGSSGARDAGVAKSQSLRDDAARAARTWAEAREAIAVALEGCKTAVEWSKEAIAHIAGGRDV